jgi:hypothetical protein
MAQPCNPEGIDDVIKARRYAVAMPGRLKATSSLPNGAVPTGISSFFNPVNNGCRYLPIKYVEQLLKPTAPADYIKARQL